MITHLKSSQYCISQAQWNSILSPSTSSLYNSLDRATIPWVFYGRHASKHQIESMLVSSRKFWRVMQVARNMEYELEGMIQTVEVMAYRVILNQHGVILLSQT